MCSTTSTPKMGKPNYMTTRKIKIKIIDEKRMRNGRQVMEGKRELPNCTLKSLILIWSNWKTKLKIKGIPKLILKLKEKKWQREREEGEPDHLVEIIHENGVPIGSHSSGAFDGNDELFLRHLESAKVSICCVAL